jgi:hypothetical protein
MSKRVLGVVFVAVWLLLGPVGMAFDGCAGCELPCARVAGALLPAVASLTPEMRVSATVPVESSPVSAGPSALEPPPPKHVRLSA